MQINKMQIGRHRPKQTFPSSQQHDEAATTCMIGIMLFIIVIYFIKWRFPSPFALPQLQTEAGYDELQLKDTKASKLT